MVVNLKCGKSIQVDEEDYELISNFHWHVDGGGYVIGRRWDRKLWKLHRVVTKAPNGMEVDHINGDKLDNRKTNLRICNHSQNGKNKTSNKGSSKYKGVSWHKLVNKWMACIRYNYKRIHIGYYKDELEAAKASNEKAKELFGEFAKLNSNV